MAMLALPPAATIAGKWLAMLLALSAAVPAPPPGPSAAPLRTLRVDYVHSGKAGEERFALDGVALEGPWPGPPDRLLDQSGLGKYRFEVKGEGGRVLFSRAFASIYGEWEGTAEAKTVPRAFHESVRFPAPVSPVQVVISGRADGGLFKELWAVPVDPASPLVDRAPSPAAGRVWAVVENGPPADKVDLLLLGDGYTPADLDKWHRDAQRMAELLFAVSPFKEHRADFNVWAIDTPSELTGVSRPSDGVYRHTPIGATYDAFGSERYVLTFENKRMREIAAAAPYEFVEIVVNDRKYGGGGIHNLYATVAADSAWAPYLFVHEFGHHFAGLADEYYTSPTSYEPSVGRPEPWEPNATADARAGKWRDLVAQGIALPTPWAKAAFEAAQRDFQARRRAIRAEKQPEEVMDALFREERDWTTRRLAPFAGKVGAFEGAMYEATGYYRPQADCIMFTRDEVGFCAVCRRAIERVIAMYARPPAAGR
jgi:IgA Peptidase M64/Peptidase M64 N-terminus